MFQQRQGDRSGDRVAAGQQLVGGSGEIDVQPRLVQLLECLPGEFENLAGTHRIGDILGEIVQVVVGPNADTLAEDIEDLR